jgi:hypothetical protein
MKRYTLAELKELPTLATSHADSLKIEKKGIRVWLSRCTVEDGEPYNNKVTVETYNKSTGYTWKIKETYQAI